MSKVETVRVLESIRSMAKVISENRCLSVPVDVALAAAEIERLATSALAEDEELRVADVG